MKTSNYTPKEEKPHVLEEPTAHVAFGDYYRLAHAVVSKKYIKNVLKRAKLSIHELIQILPISIDTYKRKTTFNPPVTEKVLEIEEVYRRGTDAFGDSFHAWMDTPNVALGNIRPKALLRNSFGVRILIDEIGRIEHGILA